MQSSKPLLEYLDKLIAAGEALLKAEFKVATGSFTERGYVPVTEFRRWHGNCLVLKTKLGAALAPWSAGLADNVANMSTNVLATLGTIQSIRDAIAGNHLVNFADLVLAETFADLLEQAEHLNSNGYWLAAGVLGRAVLEEALRKQCDRNGIVAGSPRPTLADYNMALYKAARYDKVEFKLIESLAAIGNECAHNTPAATNARVGHLLEQLSAFLPRMNA